MTYHVLIASTVSDNAPLSGPAITKHVHLMNYTNTNQLIILFTSLSRLSRFMFYIIDMLSRWNNRPVIQSIGLTAVEETMRRGRHACPAPDKHKASAAVCPTIELPCARAAADTKNHFTIIRLSLFFSHLLWHKPNYCLVSSLITRVYRLQR